MRTLDNLLLEIFNDKNIDVINFENVHKKVKENFLKIDDILPITRDNCFILNEGKYTSYYLIGFIGCYLIIIWMGSPFEDVRIYVNFDKFNVGGTTKIISQHISVKTTLHTYKCEPGWVKFLLHLVNELSGNDQIKLEKYLFEII